MFDDLKNFLIDDVFNTDYFAAPVYDFFGVPESERKYRNSLKQSSGVLSNNSVFADGNFQALDGNAPQSGYQISADAPTTAPITDQTKTESQPTTQTDNALDENDKNDIGYWKGLMKSLGDMQQDQMEFNESMTNAQMAWLERMSGTAYQRAMADMKQAGLNPILAYSQGGATTPSVSPNNYSLSGGDTLTDFLSVAVNGIANIMKAISSFLPSQSISKIFSEAVSSSTNTNYNYKVK